MSTPTIASNAYQMAARLAQADGQLAAEAEAEVDSKWQRASKQQQYSTALLIHGGRSSTQRKSDAIVCECRRGTGPLALLYFVHRYIQPSRSAHFAHSSFRESSSSLRKLSWKVASCICIRLMACALRCSSAERLPT